MDSSASENGEHLSRQGERKSRHRKGKGKRYEHSETNKIAGPPPKAAWTPGACGFVHDENTSFNFESTRTTARRNPMRYVRERSTSSSSAYSSEADEDNLGPTRSLGRRRKKHDRRSRQQEMLARPNQEWPTPYFFRPGGPLTPSTSNTSNVSQHPLLSGLLQRRGAYDVNESSTLPIHPTPLRSSELERVDDHTAEPTSHPPWTFHPSDETNRSESTEFNDQMVNSTGVSLLRAIPSSSEQRKRRRSFRSSQEASLLKAPRRYLGQSVRNQKNIFSDVSGKGPSESTMLLDTVAHSQPSTLIQDPLNFIDAVESLMRDKTTHPSSDLAEDDQRTPRAYCAPLPEPSTRPNSDSTQTSTCANSAGVLQWMQTRDSPRLPDEPIISAEPPMQLDEQLTQYNALEIEGHISDCSAEIMTDCSDNDTTDSLLGPKLKPLMEHKHTDLITSDIREHINAIAGDLQCQRWQNPRPPLSQETPNALFIIEAFRSLPLPDLLFSLGRESLPWTLEKKGRSHVSEIYLTIVSYLHLLGLRAVTFFRDGCWEMTTKPSKECSLANFTLQVPHLHTPHNHVARQIFVSHFMRSTRAKLYSLQYIGGVLFNEEKIGRAFDHAFRVQMHLQKRRGVQEDGVLAYRRQFSAAKKIGKWLMLHQVLWLAQEDSLAPLIASVGPGLCSSDESEDDSSRGVQHVDERKRRSRRPKLTPWRSSALTQLVNSIQCRGLYPGKDAISPQPLESKELPPDGTPVAWISKDYMMNRMSLQ